MDIARIKSDYITGDESLREIAKRYGVNKSMIFHRSKEEGWAKQREAHRSAVTQKAVKKSEEAKLNSYDLICRAAEDGIRNILGRIGSEGGAQDLRSLMLSLETAKNILGVKSDADMREQEARIRKLLADAAPEEKNDIVIRIEGGEEWGH